MHGIFPKVCLFFERIGCVVRAGKEKKKKREKVLQNHLEICKLHMHGTRERILLLAAPFYQLHELGPPLDASAKAKDVGMRTGW